MKKTPQAKLRNIRGQLKAIEEMMDTKASCQNVIIQCKAVKQALNGAISQYLEEEALTCIDAPTEETRAQMRTLIRELAH